MERVWQKSVLTYSVLEEDLSTVGKLLQEFFIDESAVTEDGERECFLTKNGEASASSCLFSVNRARKA